jgi:hypothetical protein
MLDHLKILLTELKHYLKIKEETIKDYLNLWKSKDNRDLYYNDYMLIAKIKDNLDQIE